MSIIMHYDLATNFDEELIDFVAKNDTQKQIKSVFGKLKSDITGGGRASFLLPEISMEQLESYIKKCNAADIEFNYLFNPLTLNDSMSNPAKNHDFTEFVERLYEVGVRSATVNSPLLCKYLKSKYSDFRVTVGLYAYPTSIQMIQYWVNIGADEITVDHAFNRDIPLLRSTLQTFKDTDVKIRLIANNFCLHGCAYKIDHAAHLGASSVSGRISGGNNVDYYLLNCTYNKVTKPAVMLCSDWIRPEDVHLYTELMEETGNTNLTLKLVERTRTTEFLERVTKAYLNERFDGNLLSLLNWSKSDEMVFRQNDQGNRRAGAPAGAPPADAQGGKPPVPPFDIEVLQKYGRSMKYPDIYIDNRKLDGFADHFFRSAECRSKLCGANLVDADSKNHSLCNYCNNWAKKAVSCNREEVESWKKNTEEVLSAIETRKIFNHDFRAGI